MISSANVGPPLASSPIVKSSWPGMPNHRRTAHCRCVDTHRPTVRQCHPVRAATGDAQHEDDVLHLRRRSSRGQSNGGPKPEHVRYRARRYAELAVGPQGVGRICSREVRNPKGEIHQGRGEERRPSRRGPARGRPPNRRRLAAPRRRRRSCAPDRDVKQTRWAAPGPAPQARSAEQPRRRRARATF